MKRGWLYALLIWSCYGIAIPFAVSALMMLFYTHNPIHVQLATNQAIVAFGLAMLGKLLSLMSVAQQAFTIYVQTHCRENLQDVSLRNPQRSSQFDINVTSMPSTLGNGVDPAVWNSLFSESKENDQ